MTTRSFRIALATVALGIVALPVYAQSTEQPAQQAVSVSTGVIDYDLAGDGATIAGAARVAFPVSTAWAVELGSVFAKPVEQVSDDATLFVAPEVQVQRYFRSGRLRPFLGAGIGFAHRNRGDEDIDSVTDVTFGATAGARIDINEHGALHGEFRMRWLGTDFHGTTAEFLAGVTIRFGDR